MRAPPPSRSSAQIRPPLGLDQTASNREAESGTAGRTRSISTPEALEHAGARFRGAAFAGVLDGDAVVETSLRAAEFGHGLAWEANELVDDLDQAIPRQRANGLDIERSDRKRGCRHQTKRVRAALTE